MIENASPSRGCVGRVALHQVPLASTGVVLPTHAPLRLGEKSPPAPMRLTWESDLVTEIPASLERR